MSALIKSVNVGRLVPTEHSDFPTTAIDKQPVAQIEVRAPGPREDGVGSGVVGDQIGDRRHHGGDTQAVYAVAREELDWWAAELGRDLRDGMFGENVTTQGLDVDAAIVGERWAIGDAVLEVTGPRIPCRTFAGFLAVPQWVKRFTQRGRTGAYLAVVTPGTLVAGEAVTVIDRPAHGLTVPQVFRASMGDLVLAQQVLDAQILAPRHHDELARKVAARTS